MNTLESDTIKLCKYEILAEISFHSKTSKKQAVKVLCSRLLARHRLSKQDISLEIVPSNEDACSSIQDNFTNLSTDESQQHTEWYAYWDKNGEDFVNETWIKQYGSCLTDDLPMDPEELYTKHREQQYHILYWKFVNEMAFTAPEVEKHAYKNFENSQCSSDNSEELDDVDQISSFDFLYKYKNFHQVNPKLTKAYWAISIMGHIYDDQNIFDSAFVEYVKKNLIKSTRHLNMYRFPKLLKSKKCDKTDTKAVVNSDEDDGNNECVSSLVDHLSISNSHNCEKKNVNNKKTSRKEKWKQYKENQIIEELKQFGYSYLQNNPKLLKYWKKRHLLFSEFEKGIQLDEESWYSVTPEIISDHIAERCSCYLIVDPFCGAGGNVIQFAKTCELVLAIDKDPKKIEMARHNAELYGVADRIQFIVGDYFALAPTLKADVVFLSPPWGGPDLMNLEEYKLSYVMPKDGGIDRMLCLARQITSNIAIHLPKNTNIFDCIKSADDGYIEIQQNVLNSRYNSITVYYSELYGLCDENA